MRAAALLLALAATTALACVDPPPPPPDPSTILGWSEVPNSTLLASCPTLPTSLGNCANVIQAWNGGVADTNHNRLLVWGGGHSDYAGNELYALMLPSGPMVRLTEPTYPVLYDVETQADGRPTARHTYGGLTYVPTRDAMLVEGGSLSGNSTNRSSVASWTIDMGTLTWTRKDPTGGVVRTVVGGNNMNFAAYDPVTDATYFQSMDTYLWRYRDDTNTMTRVSGTVYGSDVHGNAEIDPERRLFLFIGGGKAFEVNIDAANATGAKLTRIDSLMTGCAPLLAGNYPGLAYDPVLHAVVGWAGGDTVYVYHPGTRVCDSVTYSGGPGAAQPNGTFGRFRYFPTLGAFAVVNGPNSNAMLLRLH